MGITSERRRSWRTELALDCVLSRRAGRVIEARTLDIGPGGMRVAARRPLGIDEELGFELPDRPRLHGRARVVREQGYRVYALRFEQLGDEARAEVAALASAATPPSTTGFTPAPGTTSSVPREGGGSPGSERSR